MNLNEPKTLRMEIIDTEEYSIPDIETGHRYPVSKEVYDAYYNAIGIFKPRLEGVITTPIVVGTAEEFENTLMQDAALWDKPDFKVEYLNPVWKDSKQVGIWQEPAPLTYFMGTDSWTHGDIESHSICVLRNDGVVEYTNTFKNESEYEREVERLSEYYKCKPFEGDYPTNTRKR